MATTADAPNTLCFVGGGLSGKASNPRSLFLDKKAEMSVHPGRPFQAMTPVSDVLKWPPSQVNMTF